MRAETDHDLVLVTGFPRLLARLVAEEVLADGELRVALLVRGRNQDEARRWLAALDAATPGTPERVTLVEGDVTAIDLGLAGGEFLDLARRVSVIHHAAQTTHEGTDERIVRALNVQGTREVLEFARAAPGLRRLVAYSSTLVAGDHAGTVREEDFELGQGFRSPVEESLFRAEHALRRAWSQLPITIVRPAIMVGHSRTGEIDQFDGPYLFVLLLLSSPKDLTLPLPARGDAALNLVPADYVARAGVALGREPGAVSRAFHLVDPAPLPARRVFELIARAAGRRLPRGFIPVNLTRTLLRTPGLERFARTPRAFLERLAARTWFTSQGAREVLVPRGIECPSFETYVDVLVAHVRERLAARRARSQAPEVPIEDPLA